MNKQELKIYLEKKFPNCKVEETFDFPLMWIDRDNLFSTAHGLKYSNETNFDFLFCETAIDRITHFEVVYHLTSTEFHHDMVLKVKLENMDNASIESVNSLWKLLNYSKMKYTTCLV